LAFLSPPQLERYDRNLKLRNYTKGDQETLLRSKVLVVGAGGLGSPVLLYLASNGVGNITVVDSDKVELSNLQRQIIHDSESLGKPKTEVVKRKIEKLNPDVKVNLFSGRFGPSNARNLVSSHDMVVDASDNFDTKFLVNDACILENRPFSIGSVLEYHGQTSTFVPGKSPCYRCLFKQPPEGTIPTTAEVGVLGTVPGIIGVIQATEVIKTLLNKGGNLAGKLLLLDALEWEFQIIRFERIKNCPACGDSPSIELKR